MTRRTASLRARLGAVVTALAVAAAPAVAQGAGVAATASVSIPMSVAGLNTLAFGQVIPGIPKTVAFNATTAGRMRILGFGNAQLSVTLLMPAVLASGTATMPVGNWVVRTGRNSNANIAVPLVFTSGTPVTLRLAPSGTMFFFIGGRVTPAGTQPAGAYSGTITLVSAYTGN